jgi:large repetitive protein
MKMLKKFSTQNLGAFCNLVIVMALLLGSFPNDENKVIATTLLKTGSLLNEGEYKNIKDIPDAKSQSTVITLVDSFNNNQELYYNFNYTSHSGLIRTFEFKLKSENTTSKDRYAAFEVYKNTNGTLKLIDYNEYNTAGKKNMDIDIPIYTSELDTRGLNFLYLRVGLFNGDTENYSDEFFFKVWISPSFYKRPIVEGSYALFTNESTNPNTKISTGDIDYNKIPFKTNKNLRLHAYQIDAIKPFRAKNSKSNLYRRNVSKSTIPYQIGSNKDFWVFDYEKEEDYQINAKLLYSGAKVNVWVHKDEITSENAEQIGKEFDNRIYPSIVNNFGKESDVDGDGKINLLCFDIKDGFNENGGFMGGYFNQIDVMDEPKSNKGEILYIDTYPALGKNKNELTNAFSTVTHEFQHLVNHNQNVLIEGDKDGMDVWLDEAMSMAAEQIYTQRTLMDRIDYYNSSFSIAKGHSLLYWDYEGDTLANYSLSYLFGQYVKTQSRQGDAIFKEILINPNNDYKVIESIIKKYINPSISFGKFSTHFRAALLLREPFGLDGFYGDSVASSLQPRLFAGTIMDLRGGGAVVTKINANDGFFEPNKMSSNLTYMILSTNGIPPNQIPINKLKIDPVGEFDEVITGTGFINGKVIVKTNGTSTGTLLGEATTGLDGKFSIKIPKQHLGGKLYVFTTNGVGPSRSTTLTIVDKTPPVKPVVNPVGDKTLIITGMAEGLRTVYVKKAGNVISYAQADNGGKFKVELPEAQPVGTVLTVYVIDQAGNTSPEAKVTVVKSPPVISNVEKFTETDVTVSGETDPNSIVYVKKDSTIIGKGVSNRSGHFNIKISLQQAGTELLIYSEDSLGMISKEVWFTVTPVPAKPNVSQMTDSATLLKGKTAHGLTIIVKLGDKTLGEAVSNVAGTFTVDIGEKQKAGTLLTVYALNEFENKSLHVTVTVVDKTPPPVPIVNGAMTTKTTSVSGKAEISSSVYIYNGTKLVAKITADKNGTFKSNIKAQKKGAKLTIFAKDKAGNKSRVKMIVVK